MLLAGARARGGRRSGSILKPPAPFEAAEELARLKAFVQTLPLYEPEPAAPERLLRTKDREATLRTNDPKAPSCRCPLAHVGDARRLEALCQSGCLEASPGTLNRLNSVIDANNQARARAARRARAVISVAKALRDKEYSLRKASNLCSPCSISGATPVSSHARLAAPTAIKALRSTQLQPKSSALTKPLSQLLMAGMRSSSSSRSSSRLSPQWLTPQGRTPVPTAPPSPPGATTHRLACPKQEAASCTLPSCTSDSPVPGMYSQQHHQLQQQKLLQPQLQHQMVQPHELANNHESSQSLPPAPRLPAPCSKSTRYEQPSPSLASQEQGTFHTPGRLTSTRAPPASMGSRAGMAGSLSSAARSNSGAPAAAGHLPVRVMRLHEAGPEQSLAVLEPVSEHAELRRALMTRDTAPSIEHSRAQLLPRALRSPRGCLEHIRDGVAAALASAWELLYALRELLYYYAFGCIAYAHLEGWTVEESLYFLTVTATTVGYGDFTPASHEGYLFTCAYAVIGPVVVLNALAPLQEVLHGAWRKRLLRCLCCGWCGSSAEEEEDVEEDTRLSIEQVNARMHYARRYAAALVAPLLVLTLGVVLHYTLIREPPLPAAAAEWSGMDALWGGEATWASAWMALRSAAGLVDWWALVDGLYYAVITMTTIGYGDIHPVSPRAHLIITAYLPLAVIALADCLSELSMISVHKTIRETDYAKIADECLLRDALRGLSAKDAASAANLEPELTEAEFLVDTLTAHGLVDPAAVIAISKQFRRLTRRGVAAPGLADPDGTATSTKADRLTMRMVYEELRHRSKLGQPLSDGANALDIDEVTGRFKWGSFEEWRAQSWRPRVLSRAMSLNGSGEGAARDFGLSTRSHGDECSPAMTATASATPRKGFKMTDAILAAPKGRRSTATAEAVA